MILKLNLKVQCQKDNHQDEIERVCYNQFCTEFRLNCFKCIQKGGIHNDHLGDVQKLTSLLDFIDSKNNECNMLIDDLNTYIESVNQSFSQLKRGIRQKYSFQKERLEHLNSKQINDLLNSTIKLSEYKQSITTILSEQTKKITHSFHNLYAQLQLSSFNYYLIDDIDNQQLKEQQYFGLNQNNSQSQFYKPIHEAVSQIQVTFDNQRKKQEEFFNEQLEKQSIKYQQLNQNYEKVRNEKQLLQDTINRKDQQLQSMNSEIQQLQSTQTYTQQPILQSSPLSKPNPFIYQQILNTSIKQENYCYAIDINKDCSIVIAGSKNEINVFQFKQGMLKQAQNLREHKGDVNTLRFMKKSNQFISGSDDNYIIIWSLNQSNKWVCQQKLIGHNDWIYCQVLNNNEDLIVSGSKDNTIKFWVKQNQWLCYQTITDHTGTVYGLSLNEKQNKMISCGRDAQILIIEQQVKDSLWIVIQKIKVETFGYRISFINYNLFTFQPFDIEQMHVYEMNDTKKHFFKTKDILIKGGGNDYWLFPQQYIKQKCLLVNRNGKYVNLIRIKENGEFNTEQYIEFGNSFFFGCMSDDGQYLITWEESVKLIQIRKYYEQ